MLHPSSYSAESTSGSLAVLKAKIALTDDSERNTTFSCCRNINWNEVGEERFTRTARPPLLLGGHGEHKLPRISPEP